MAKTASRVLYSTTSETSEDSPPLCPDVKDLDVSESESSGPVAGGQQRASKPDAGWETEWETDPEDEPETSPYARRKAPAPNFDSSPWSKPETNAEMKPKSRPRREPLQSKKPPPPPPTLDDLYAAARAGCKGEVAWWDKMRGEGVIINHASQTEHRINFSDIKPRYGGLQPGTTVFYHWNGGFVNFWVHRGMTFTS